MTNKLQGIDVELIMISLAALCRIESEKITDDEDHADVKREALKEISTRMLYRAHELAPGTYKGDEDGQDDPSPSTH